MVDLTPLNLADSLESFLSLLVLYFFKQDIAWLSSLQTLLTNLNFRIAKYLSVICLPYLFLIKPFITLNSEGVKEFSSEPIERRKGMKEFSNGLTTMVQQEITLLMA